LTGHADLRGAQSCVNDGHISRFLLKPCDDDKLRTSVREAVQHYNLRRKIRQLRDRTRHQRNELREWNQVLEQRVRERTEALTHAYDDTLNSLVLVLDHREHRTGGHSRRVGFYCVYLAVAMGLPEQNLENLFRGAILHDIGKIGIPDVVLLKPGPLLSEDRGIIEQHVAIGVELIEGISYLRPAVTIPRYHHERWDGTGYLEGLAGTAIPIEARLFAVVDVYDALTSDRAYKAAISHAEAVINVTSQSGKQFDPDVVSAFLSVPPVCWLSLAAAARSAERFRDILRMCRTLHGSWSESQDQSTNAVSTLNGQLGIHASV
jgi:putative two-component system response regulator